MSYSRWSGTDWYIFWCDCPENKDKQPFLAIWCRHAGDEPLFYASYTKLKEAKGDYDFVPYYNEHETKHCKECIESFIKDVESELKYNPDGGMLEGWTGL